LRVVDETDEFKFNVNLALIDFRDFATA